MNGMNGHQVHHSGNKPIRVRASLSSSPSATRCWHPSPVTRDQLLDLSKCHQPAENEAERTHKESISESPSMRTILPIAIMRRRTFQTCIWSGRLMHGNRSVCWTHSKQVARDSAMNPAPGCGETKRPGVQKTSGPNLFFYPMRIKVAGARGRMPFLQEEPGRYRWRCQPFRKP